MSSPSRRTSPAIFAPSTDSCIRFKMRRKVDLPQPEGRMRAVTEAGGTDNETSSSTWVSPNHAETSTASSREVSGRASGPTDELRGSGDPARLPLVPGWTTAWSVPAMPLCPSDPDDRLVERLTALGPEEPGAAVVEDPAVGSHFPVAVAGGGGGKTDDRLVQRLAALGAIEAGVAEVEDPAVGSHFPVAVAGRRGGDPDDGLVQGLATLGAIEAGAAEAEDAAVTGNLPVTVAGWRGGDPDDRLVQRLGAPGAVERGGGAAEEARGGGGTPPGRD